MPGRSQSNPPCTAHLTAKKHSIVNRPTTGFILAAIYEETESNKASFKISSAVSPSSNEAGKQINHSSRDARQASCNTAFSTFHTTSLNTAMAMMVARFRYH